MSQAPAPPVVSVPAAPGYMDVRTRLYMWLTGVFVTSLLVADITGSKFFYIPIFTVGDFHFVTHSCGMLSFPITFLLTDLINEYYGKKGARRVTYLGLAMAALSFVLIFTARMMPVAAESPIPNDVFNQVFAMSNRLYIASLTAYLVGQLCDIWLFGILKRLTSGRMVWLRATGSTVVSQAIDSFLVTFILFYGNPKPDGSVLPFNDILHIAATGYILKFLIAIALTPVIYAGRRFIHVKFGMMPVPATSVA
jgi:uncharacterized integral membrane protein (TIGR00697 family)